MKKIVEKFGLRGLKGKILLVGATITLVSLSLTGSISAYNVMKLLDKKAELEMRVAAKLIADQIMDTEKRLINDIINKSKTRKTRESLLAFSSAFKSLDAELSHGRNPVLNGALLSKLRKETTAELERVLVPALKVALPEENISANQYIHSKSTAKVLQYVYNIKNPAELGSKNDLYLARDIRENREIPSDLRNKFSKTKYAAIHQKNHQELERYRASLGLYDLFLVSKQGDVVYSACKEYDFGGNLINGPQAKTGLGEAFNEVHQKAMSGSLILDPYMTKPRPYDVSYNQLAIFLSIPVYSADKYLGVLIYQVPRFYQNLVSFRGNYERYGMGKTGEGNLIKSKDGTFMSNVRLIDELESNTRNLAGPMGENPYRTTELTLKLDKETLERIKDFDEGGASMGIISDYIGKDAVFAATEVDFFGQKAIVMIQQEEEEILASAREVRAFITFISFVLVAIAVVIFYIVGGQISSPIVEASSMISTTSAEMAATIDEQERTIAQQSAAVNQTSTTMEELERNSSQTAEQTDTVSEGSQMVLQKTQEGTQMVYDSLDGMQSVQDKVTVILDQIVQLSDKTEQIKSIANLVTELADETHMLALNAAVEAARAGEHGKGFAVVALEIRRLADESKKSAEKIDNLVADILKANHSTVMAAEDGSKQIEKNYKSAKETSATFEAINESMNQITDNISQISHNIRQQAMGIVDVVKSMNVINDGAKESAAGMAQTQTAIHQLNDAAKSLKEIT